VVEWGGGVSDDETEHGQRAADDDLMAHLRRVAAEADPVPEVVLLAARAAIGSRDLDAELATLVGDSATEPGSDPARFQAVRAAGGAAAQADRMLSFAGAGVHLDLEITRSGGRINLTGQIHGAPTQGCVLEYWGGPARTLELDELGRFLLAGAERGTVRLRLTAAGGGRVLTPWVNV